ncbi:MAG: DUF4340 domain-containing protein [Dokdonella sp.]
MMNQKSLIGLGVATLAVVVVAFAVQHARKPVSDFSEQAGSLVADLGNHVNDVNRLVVTTANKNVAVTLAKKDGTWTIAEKGGYAADLGKLREYLLKVADAKLVEKKTAKADRYVDIGLSDISNPKAKGIAVDIDGLSTPVSFITGIYNAQGGGTYVRRSAEEQSWLATGNLIPDKDPANWLHKELANIPSDRIASVTITHADGKTLRVSKDSAAEAHYTIADVPKGREPSSEFAANGLASVLADLKLDDVASEKDVPIPDKATLVRYATFDGVLVDAKIWQVGDKHYVAMSASEDTDLAQKHADAELAKAASAAAIETAQAAEKKLDSTKTAEKDNKKPELEPGKNREQRFAAIATEVETLNKTFKGWSFVLPGYKVSNIDKSIEDLLKPLEAKTPEVKAKPKSAK